ncbi:sigma-70 family RNA polymerase sigma factor [bacterium]|nr:sigma-70 family RNA polymerase sigma factor [bacterium]MDC0278575.1 sigma-70 family RNA polymerase sigma factor [bacterium]
MCANKACLHGESIESDSVLLEIFKETASEDAAYQLHQRYSERLLALVRSQCSVSLRSRFDPEDVAQSVFRTIFRRSAHGEYVLPDSGDLWALLLVVCMNKVRSRATFHRAGKRSVERTVSLHHDILSPDRRNSDTDLELLKMSIDEILSELPDRQQEIVRLRVLGSEIAEIAEISGRSLRTIERVLQRFRDELNRRVL